MTLITDMTERLDEYFAVKSNLIDHYARHVNETGEADPKTLREYPGAMAFKLYLGLKMPYSITNNDGGKII